MDSGLSTMSLQKGTSYLATPKPSPLKDEARRATSTRTQGGGGPKKSLSRRFDASAEGQESKSTSSEGSASRVRQGSSASLLADLRSKEKKQTPSGEAASQGPQSEKSRWPAPKEGGVILDLIVDCDVDKLWQLFKENDEESTLWRRFNRHRKYEDVQSEPWQRADGAAGGREVEVMNKTYITGFKSSFIRGKHKTYETHTITLSEAASVHCLEVKAKVPTLPIGDCMYTVVQYCFARRDASSSFLRSSYEIVYTKKASFKSLIEKNTASGIKDTMRDLRATLATITGVRSAPASARADRRAPTRETQKFKQVITHEIFAFLMQNSHAILALLCFLYLAAERIGLVRTDLAAPSPPNEELCSSIDPEGEGMCDSSSAGSTDALRGSRVSEFCSSALLFWVSGYVFKFLVLACHWVITNASILVLLVLKILRPFFRFSGRVANSTLVKKISEPVKETMRAMLKQLEIKKVIPTEASAEMTQEEDNLSPGEVVPAAAEAAMIVSKIANLNHLSPAAQAEAVKGLRDRKQAQLVRNDASVQRVDSDPAGSGLVVEEVFENQRYQPFRGWGSSWPGHLLPTDCGKWSDRVGLPKVGTQSQMFELVAPALPPNWVWLETEWQIDLSCLKEGRVDKDGFYYGVMAFSSLKDFPPASTEAGKKTMKKFIRRRRWTRTRIHSQKIREVLMGKDSEALLGSSGASDSDDPTSMKAKIETLLGWRKPGKKPSNLDSSWTALSLDGSQLSTSGNTGKSQSQEFAKKEAEANAALSPKDVQIGEIFEQEERIGSHNEWGAPIPQAGPTAGGTKDLKRWANRDGSVSSAVFKEVAPTLPRGYKWVGHWNVDNSKELSPRVDEDGWTYGKDFWPILMSQDFPKGLKQQNMETKARRRRWIRHQRRMNEEEEEEMTSPEMDLPLPAETGSAHSSVQLDALNLSPNERAVSMKEARTVGTHHKRNSSKSTLDVLDLCGTYTKDDDEEAAPDSRESRGREREGARDESMPPTPSESPSSKILGPLERVLSSGLRDADGVSLGPLEKHLPTLERRCSIGSRESSLDACGSPQSLNTNELTLADLQEARDLVTEEGEPTAVEVSPLKTDKSVAVTVSDTSEQVQPLAAEAGEGGEGGEVKEAPGVAEGGGESFTFYDTAEFAERHEEESSGRYDTEEEEIAVEGPSAPEAEEEETSLLQAVPSLVEAIAQEEEGEKKEDSDHESVD